MARITCLILITYFAKSALAIAVDVQKDQDYTKCALKSQALFIEGIKNIVDSSDPLALDFVPGNLPDFKYQFKDAKLTGLKGCTVTSLRVNKEKFTFDYNLECPHIELNSKYIFAGRLANISVAEEGDLTVKTGFYVLMFHGYYEKRVSEDKKEHAHIKYYFLDFDPRENVEFKFSNFKSGDEEQSNNLHKFMNENWLKMDKNLRAPVLNTFMDVLIQHINDFLKFVAIDEVFKASC